MESCKSSQKNRRLAVKVNMKAEDIDRDTADGEDFIYTVVNLAV
jgi:hypothetical protein